MWAKEREMWKEEEQRLKEKIAKINADTKDFLKKQVQEKVDKKTRKMDVREQLLNKGLMKEIKAKKKDLEEKQASDKKRAAASEVSSVA